MDELRVVRREDDALILANELGEEYKFVVDEVAATEFRQLSKKPMGALSVRPREIQALLRAGKTREEVASDTGLEESDVERFEEPVRAEQRYILELAHAVPVRTESPQVADEQPTEQQFGEVIAERLIGLGNQTSAWRSWRDETAGWLVGLTFDTRDGEHDAVWGFDHRKRVLNPLTPDATNLSKLGDVGDRLIPKLRAVDNEQRQRFDSDAFDPDALIHTGDGLDFDVAAPSPTEAEAAPLQKNDDEYERRREIDQLAVKTTEPESDDLSETADLLDALRRRRGERAERGEHGDEMPPARTGAAANIWGASGVADQSDAAEEAGLRAVDATPRDTKPDRTEPTTPARTVPEDNVSQPDSDPREPKSTKRGRSSIPSWDDILFGTRSDDDPA